MKTLIFQHTMEEVPGTLVDYLAIEGLSYHIHHPYAGARTPDPSEYDWLVVLGGPMNIDEEHKHPWLKAEKRFVEAWVKQNKAVLGICLGGQMLAQVLGARVEKNFTREIGFHEVKRTGAHHPALAHWPEVSRVFQYHEDKFSLPSGCTTLLTSEICEHQAFALNERTVGIQFHPESTSAWILDAFKKLQSRPQEIYVQSEAECKAHLPVHLPMLTANFFSFLRDFREGAGLSAKAPAKTKTATA